jgi:hypothetical protein
MVTVGTITAKPHHYGDKQGIGQGMSDGDGNEKLGAGEGCDAESRSAPERLE